MNQQIPDKHSQKWGNIICEEFTLFHAVIFIIIYFSETYKPNHTGIFQLVAQCCAFCFSTGQQEKFYQQT